MLNVYALLILVIKGESSLLFWDITGAFYFSQGLNKILITRGRVKQVNSHTIISTRSLIDSAAARNVLMFWPRWNRINYLHRVISLRWSAATGLQDRGFGWKRRFMCCSCTFTPFISRSGAPLPVSRHLIHLAGKDRLISILISQVIIPT